MNPVAVKLAIVAIDQITLWTTAWMKARDNPEMTEEQADQLVAETKAQAGAISDDWRSYRAGD